MSCGVFLFTLGFVVLSSTFHISNVLKKCDTRDDDLDDCLLTNLNVIIPSLKSGWEWEDMDGIDPVNLQQKLTPYYHDGNMTLDLVLTDSVIDGLSHSKIVVVRSKAFSIGKLELMTTTPSVTYRGRYVSEGYTGLFPLHSTGFFNITFVDVNTAWVVYLSKMKIEDQNFLRVTNLNVDAMPVQIFIDGAHTFDGSNEIAQDMKTSLNANSIELYNLLKPRLMKFMSSELINYINALLETTPLDHIVSGLNLQDWKKR